ncbi:MAG: hypothetical protein HY675_09510 [Chloroflexi bacterium]|nr:hypothetical protein [Chloroflexota bacterium]
MRIAYVLAPFFVVAVERQRNPDLAQKPVVVGGRHYERKPVFAASPACLKMGVKTGMSLRQAHYLCPEAVFLPTDQERYESVFEELLAVLDSFSPAVERDGLGAAYLDCEGLDLLFGKDEQLGQKIVDAVKENLGLAVRVAIGPTRFVVKTAARLPRESNPTIIPPYGGSRFLQNLSVDLLPLSDFSRQRLQTLGIRTIGQFAKLPSLELMEQFGADACTAHKMASGKDEQKVLCRKKTATLERSLALERSIETLGEFSSIAQKLLAYLVDQLRGDYLACELVTLYVELDDGTGKEASMWLREPTSSAGDLLCALQQMAARLRCENGIALVKVSLSALGAEASKQMGLFDGQRRRRAHLERAIDEIQERFGSDMHHGDTERRRGAGYEHHGGTETRRGTRLERSRRLQPARSPYTCRADTPDWVPLSTKLTVITGKDGKPAFVIRRGRKERARVCNNWRVEDGWWKENVSREYYRLITASGTIMVVYFERDDQGWYLEKIVD